MNPRYESLLDQFAEDQDTFETMQSVATGELTRIVEARGMLLDVMESRIKTPKSLAGKLELKGEKYHVLSDVTDLVGVRLVTFYEDEIDVLAADIEQSFEVDWENSVDKRAVLDADRFGYLSLHYVCRIPKSLYCEAARSEINEYRFEIQLRTTLQHVWATIFHDTGYKSDVEVPREYIRKLNRLAGLLEIADDEFRTIRDEINDYRDAVRQMMSQRRYDEISLSGDSWKDYLQTKPFRGLAERIASVTNAEIAPCNQAHYLKVIKMLGCKTIGDVERMRNANEEDAYAYAKTGLEGTGLDIVMESLALQSILQVEICKQGYGEEGLREYFDLTHGRRERNAKLAARVYRRMVQAGVVPA